MNEFNIARIAHEAKVVQAKGKSGGFRVQVVLKAKGEQVLTHNMLFGRAEDADHLVSQINKRKSLNLEYWVWKADRKCAYIPMHRNPTARYKTKLFYLTF